jgi:hypothetical protein
MGLLDKLWDDVVAGPQPEKGLKQLRKPKLATDISVPSDGMFLCSYNVVRCFICCCGNDMSGLVCCISSNFFFQVRC